MRKHTGFSGSPFLLQILLLYALGIYRYWRLKYVADLRRRYPALRREWARERNYERALTTRIRRELNTVDFKVKPPDEGAPRKRERARKEPEFAYPAKLGRLKGSNFDKSDCLVDSGASSHIWNCITDVARWRTRERTKFKGIGGKRAVCVGRADIVVKVKDENGDKAYIVLQNVAIIPESPMRLLAVSKLEDAGGDVSFRQRKLMLPNLQGAGHVAYPFSRKGDLYHIEMRAIDSRPPTRVCICSAAYSVHTYII